MVKLLVIADDMTGALDTGVIFAAYGADTKVVFKMNRAIEWQGTNGPEVLVINTESRHNSPTDAYQAVYELAVEANAHDVPYIYKKCDSALRGNIGSELTAILDAKHYGNLYFAPAFPDMGRTTCGGIQFIDEVPVEKSVYANDPFEPIKRSYIPELIATQSDVPVCIIDPGDPLPLARKQIVVMNSNTQGALQKAANQLADERQLTMTAGCAGFARLLPHLLGIERRSQPRNEMYGKLIVICGSVNPVTGEQLEYAEQQGFKSIQLSPEQALTENYFETTEGTDTLNKWMNICKKNDRCVVRTGGRDRRCDGMLQYALKKGISEETMRERITQNLGQFAARVMRQEPDAVLFVTGGDTLCGMLEALGCYELIPIREILPGTVLSYYRIDGERRMLVSKSGGFGNKDQIVKIAEMMEERYHAEKIHA